MRQPIWSSFEVALLIDSYWRIENGQITKKQAVSEISSVFRQYAVNQGINIDDTYRNENGISMRFEELRYLFTGGKTGIKNTSKLFRVQPKQCLMMLFREIMERIIMLRIIGQSKMVPMTF